MNRALATGVLALIIVLGASLPVLSARTDGNAVHSVAMQTLNPDGTIAALRFEVLAGSTSEADRTAREAVAALAPGALILEPGSARAAWLPWSWRWEASALPVPVAYNPEGAPASVGPDAIVAGLQAWSNAGETSFRYRYAGITNNRASILELGPDGENVVSWVSLDCQGGCVLGVTSKDESVHEIDMMLNSNPQAAEQLGVGTRVDWRTVILHELGHMAGLEHSCPVPFGPCTDAEADAVMFFQYRGISRTLAADDIAGLRALYPANTLPPGVSPTPPAPDASPAPTPFPEFPVVLERGWNLVLLPGGPASAVPAALNCVAAIYTQVDGEWRSHIPGVAPALQTLTNLQANSSYWVLATQPCARFL